MEDARGEFFSRWDVMYGTLALTGTHVRARVMTGLGWTQILTDVNGLRAGDFEPCLGRPLRTSLHMSIQLLCTRHRSVFQARARNRRAVAWRGERLTIVHCGSVLYRCRI